jgi:prophage regulatory protein
MHNTVARKMIGDPKLLEQPPEEKTLTKAQKDFIRYVARVAVEEYLKMGPTDRIVGTLEVLRRTGFSRSTLYRVIERGTFPKSFDLGTRTVGWKESELVAWFNAQQEKDKHLL